MFQIYKITNNVTQQIYIGSSVDVQRRWRNHKEASINPNDVHYNYPLMQAFRLFGIDNFTFEILKTVETYEDMIKLEADFINQYDCIYPKGYNQTNRTDSPMFDPKIAEKMSQTKRRLYGKRVCEIDNNNNILQIWDSIIEAAEQTKLNRYKISNVCSGIRLTTGGKKFRLLDDDNNIIEPQKITNQITSHRITKNSRKVAQYDLNNNLIEIFDSISLAADKLNCDSSRISAVCRGKRNTTAGYIWRYVNE